MTDILTNAAEFTVTEISNAVKRTVEESFGYVRVRGEISGFRGQHASGHAYFTLKDAGACIDAVVWKGNFARLRFKPEEGLEVIATGRLTTFPRSSKYQIVIEALEPAGAGALMALLEERRRKLQAEGLFDRERKRPLPYLPRVIGVITSPTGAVIRDILHRLDDRFPSHVLVWPVRVQGETCAPEVVTAVEGFNALEANGSIPRPDLLIVARGGGSIEDLWGFNEEAVVRAIAASAIPVISAVGHETDTTLVDYAADMRAPTPTAAAEAAVPVRSELIGYVEDQGQRQRSAARRIAASLRDRLRAASAGLPRPADLVTEARQRLDHAGVNLLAALRHAGQRKTIELNRVSPRLSPLLLRQRTAELSRRLGDAGRRSDAGLTLCIERRDNRLRTIAAGLSTRALEGEIRHARARLAPLADRLVAAHRPAIGQRRERLDTLGQLLASYSYRNVLARGFALVTDAEGEIVRARGSLAPGDTISIEFADGEIGATIAGAPASPVRRKKSGAVPEAGQQTLF
ncbi:exodeoxyribonuclease VII large subunit [Arsenicitalea aurantiaca]|uniref:Exodeoxyribonuclease 7 large subunit n=1 Tax=Arsenicitalea aurantiaca TaxID=1783274 RepID=A0A433XAR5_9HYPH|nr:exodeoxyribonuclease VII large subunit [Arsenicitalea aurantiaca]RUT31191.1 exodeoxyribonuclease VII large subunit [Arsenicitalea aurantiaca]